MSFDVARVRADFPVLDREVHGHRLVYLDSAATSQKPRSVIDTMSAYYELHNANVHRGIHTLAEEATVAYESARVKVANFVGAPDPRGVVFTKNATEAVNLIAYSWARRKFGPGDEIVATQMEHHSNIVPWQMAASDTGATLKFLPVTDDGYLDLSELESTITDRTKIVAVTAMSNVLGTMPHVRRIADAAHAVGALVVVDAAQYVPHVPCDMQALGADMLVLSAHKMLGPTGVGCLVTRPELLEEMDPFLGGGEMISDVRLEGSTWAAVPHKFEAGTPAIAEAIGLGAAIDYLENLGMAAVREHEIDLTRYALKALGEVDGLHVYGPTEPEDRGAAFSFNVFGPDGDLIHPHDMGTMLDQYGVAIRAGHHCARPLMRRFDVPAMCRASCYVYSTPQDIDLLVSAIEATRKFFIGG